MARQIAWTVQAKADIRAIDQPAALHILHCLARFATLEEGDIKQLMASTEFRLRVGAYRIRFRDAGESIEILRVRHRREAYR